MKSSTRRALEAAKRIKALNKVTTDTAPMRCCVCDKPVHVAYEIDGRHYHAECRTQPRFSSVSIPAKRNDTDAALYRKCSK